MESGPAANIRYILGAVGGFATIVSDDEIRFAMETYPSDWRLAAAFMADSLASRAITDPSSFSLTSVMSVSWANRAEEWRKLAVSLRSEAAQAVRDAAITEPAAISVTGLKHPRVLDRGPIEYRRRGVR